MEAYTVVQDREGGPPSSLRRAVAEGLARRGGAGQQEVVHMHNLGPEGRRGGLEGGNSPAAWSLLVPLVLGQPHPHTGPKETTGRRRKPAGERRAQS